MNSRNCGELRRTVSFFAFFPFLIAVAAAESQSMASTLLTLQALMLSPRPRICFRQNSPTVSTSSCYSSVEDRSRWHCKKQQFSDHVSRKSSSLVRSGTIRSSLTTPIISPQDQWGTWTALFAAGAFGIW